MDRRKLFWGLGLATGFVALVLLDGRGDRLSISQKVGGGTTIVEVTGPQALLDRAAAFTASRAAQGKACDDLAPFQTPGFHINWGDEKYAQTYISPLPPLSEGCPDPLKHVFAVPGQYRITAYLAHMGSSGIVSDTLIIEWKDGRSIAIEGESPPLAFSLVAPRGNKRLFFREPLTVRWKLSTPTPVNLLIEVFDRDGIMLGKSRFRGLKYSGEGEARIRYDEQAYAEHLRNEATPVIARIRVQDHGRDIVIAESEPFRVTAQWDPRFVRSQVDLVPGAARTVRLRHHPATFSFHSYGIDWGDGLPIEIHASAGPGADGTCGPNEGPIDTRHTYRQAGDYTIILRIIDSRDADRSLANGPYESLQVAVP